MNVKPTLILAGLLILLSGIFFFLVQTRTVKKQDERPQVWSVEEEKIQRITIFLPREQNALTFFKDQDDRWRFEDKTKSPVDIKRWGGIVLLVSGPKSKRMIAEKADNLSEYEFNDPQMVVILGLQNRKDPLEILFGGRTPQGDQFYVKLKNSPTIYIMHSIYCEVLMRLVQEPPYPSPAKAVQIKKEKG